MKKEIFIQKWSSWWRLEKKYKLLTSAFELELRELLKEAYLEGHKDSDKYWKLECKIKK